MFCDIWKGVMVFLFCFVLLLFLLWDTFINFCLDNTYKVSMVYSNTHSSFILSPVDELQMLCSRSVDISSFTHPGRKGTTRWSVVFLLQMRVAKNLSNTEQETTWRMSCLLTHHLLKASHKPKYNIHEMGKYRSCMGKVNIYFAVILSIRVTFLRPSVLVQKCSISHILKRWF